LVLQVLSGDSLKIKNLDTGLEEKIFLSSIIAPKFKGFARDFKEEKKEVKKEIVDGEEKIEELKEVKVEKKKGGPVYEPYAYESKEALRSKI